MIVFTVIQNVGELSMRNLVPHLMKLDQIIKPCNLSNKLVIVSLGEVLLLLLFVLDALPEGPLDVLEQGEFFARSNF